MNETILTYEEAIKIYGEPQNISNIDPLETEVIDNEQDK